VTKYICTQDSTQLNNVLYRLMRERGIPKVGLELTSDLRKLARSYPNMSAFQAVNCTLDLTRLWQLYTSKLPSKYGNGARVRPGAQVGLSYLAEALLGKPLDKSMQARSRLTFGNIHVPVPQCRCRCSLKLLDTSEGIHC
jgi:hypothetical protein